MEGEGDADECPVSLEAFSESGRRQPRFLPDCGHTFSRDSIGTLLTSVRESGSAVLECPLCGTAQPRVHDVSSCKPNWILIERLARRNAARAQRCDAPLPAATPPMRPSPPRAPADTPAAKPALQRVCARFLSRRFTRRPVPGPVSERSAVHLNRGLAIYSAAPPPPWLDQRSVVRPVQPPPMASTTERTTPPPDSANGMPGGPPATRRTSERFQRCRKPTGAAAPHGLPSRRRTREADALRRSPGVPTRAGEGATAQSASEAHDIRCVHVPGMLACLSAQPRVQLGRYRGACTARSSCHVKRETQLLVRLRAEANVFHERAGRPGPLAAR